MRDTKVALKVCRQYDYKFIKPILKDGFDLLGGLEKYIKSTDTVLIKPDLYCVTEPNEAKTTNPHIISALAELINGLGAKCIIADSPKGEFKQSVLDGAYIKTQMLQASNNGYAMLNTNDNITVITNDNGVCSRDIHVIDTINDANIIINVGKLRCDKNLGLIGCAQNLFGLVPGSFKQLVKSRCYTLKSYYNYNIDLYEALENKVVLNILDGIVGCEANNDPRILNTILISENPYTIDATALKIINQNPETNPLLIEGASRGALKFDYQLVGDDIEQLVCSDFNYTQFLENIKDRSNSFFQAEYNRTHKRPIISSKLCKGCKVCVNLCPMQAINMKHSLNGEHASVDYGKCVNCFKCVEGCPYKIITTKTPFRYQKINKLIKKSLKTK